MDGVGKWATTSAWLGNGDSLDELCRLIDESGLLANAANVYLELDRARPEPVLPDGWQVLKSKTAGNVRYSLVAAGDRN